MTAQHLQSSGACRLFCQKAPPPEKEHLLPCTSPMDDQAWCSSNKKGRKEGRLLSGRKELCLQELLDEPEGGAEGGAGGLPVEAPLGEALEGTSLLLAGQERLGRGETRTLLTQPSLTRATAGGPGGLAGQPSPLGRAHQPPAPPRHCSECHQSLLHVVQPHPARCCLSCCSLEASN